MSTILMISLASDAPDCCLIMSFRYSCSYSAAVRGMIGPSPLWVSYTAVM